MIWLLVFIVNRFLIMCGVKVIICCGFLILWVCVSVGKFNKKFKSVNLMVFMLIIEFFLCFNVSIKSMFYVFNFIDCVS